MTKTWTTALLAVLLAACGGSSASRVTKSFSYGAPIAPSAAASATASALEGGAVDALAFQASGGDSGAASAGVYLAALPDAVDVDSAVGVAAATLRETALSAAPGSPDALVAASVSRAIAAARGGDALVQSGCWTATPTSVTFSHCQVDAADTTGVAFGLTLDGTISKPSASEAKWDLTATASGTAAASGLSGFEFSIHYFGDLTVTPSTVDGFAQSDKAATVSANGQTISIAFTTSADFEKVVVTDGCATGGAVELKRIWTKLPAQPAGAAADPFLTDRAVKFTWQGCGAVLVQTSP
ncbi:MAG: hypothetical protein ACJ79R_22550 [Anaeromyxobacteraceae bacterium]